MRRANVVYVSYATFLWIQSLRRFFAFPIACIDDFWMNLLWLHVYRWLFRILRLLSEPVLIPHPWLMVVGRTATWLPLAVLSLFRFMVMLLFPFFIRIVPGRIFFILIFYSIWIVSGRVFLLYGCILPLMQDFWNQLIHMLEGYRLCRVTTMEVFSRLFLMATISKHIYTQHMGGYTSEP